ncbi:hypothetical protein ACWCSD_24215 [Nonomuraea sp. NPDC001684]
MSSLETLENLPGMTLRGTVVKDSEAGFVVDVQGQLVEVPAGSLLNVARTDEEVELTLAPDTQLLMRGITSPIPELIESDVFDELPFAGSESDNGTTTAGGNCNCNCNGGNCNCNCNCAAILSEEALAVGTIFRRAVS